MLIVFARMAWRNIFYNRRKSAMAIIAVASCYFALNIFQGYILGTEQIFEDSYSKRSMLGDILIKKTGTAHFMSIEEDSLLDSKDQEFVENFIKKSGDVEAYVRFLRINGTLSNGTSSTVVIGTGHDVVSGEKMRAPVWSWNTLAGKPLANEDKDEILLGQGLANLLDCRPTSNEQFITGRGGYSAVDRPFECSTKRMQFSGTTLHGQANAIEVETQGLMDAMFREIDLRFVYLPLRLAQKMLDTDRISYFTIKMKPGADSIRFIENFQKEAQNLTAHSWKEDELGDFYKKTLSFLHVFRNFMVIVILGVALLSIFNTFLRNIQERTREIGVLRTLGFRPEQIRILFFMETFFLASIGCLSGCVVAIVASSAINQASILYKVGLLTQPVPFLVFLSPITMFATFLVVIAVALSAIIAPLWRSEKKKITESLSYV